MKTKIVTIVTVILLALFTTCNKDENNGTLVKGVITGYDYKMCDCCGGWLINLNSDSTELYTIDTRFIDKHPDNLILDSATVFPIFIRLAYTNSPANCGKAIDITMFVYR